MCTWAALKCFHWWCVLFMSICLSTSWWPNLHLTRCIYNSKSLILRLTADLWIIWICLLVFFFTIKKVFIYLWLHLEACGILVPQPRIGLKSPALKAWSLNHWIDREKLLLLSFATWYCSFFSKLISTFLVLKPEYEGGESQTHTFDFFCNLTKPVL